jgi:hypothetical protein
MKHWPYLSQIGIERIGSDDWQDRTELSIRSYQKLEAVATMIWKKRGIDWDKK